MVKIHLQLRRPGFDPWIGKIPWRRERLLTPVFWPREFHGLNSPWGRRVGHNWVTSAFTFHLRLSINQQNATLLLSTSHNKPGTGDDHSRHDSWSLMGKTDILQNIGSQSHLHISDTPKLCDTEFFFSIIHLAAKLKWIWIYWDGSKSSFGFFRYILWKTWINFNSIFISLISPT